MQSVEVRGDDIDRAIRDLKKVVGRDGVQQEVRRRDQWPNKTDRKKAKAILAARKRLKREKKKARVLENRRGRVYDRDFEVRKFNWAHRIDG